MNGVKLKVDQDIAEIIFSNPPVNALSAGLRRGIADALATAINDETIRAIVIRGDGKLFSAGAEITEFGQPAQPPSLPALVEAIESSPKPVVAAIHGICLGGGLEVALACHWRVASPSAMLGLPEARLGLIPGAGGTQRLPRLIGAEAALNMIVFGDPVPAGRALEIGLVDQIAGEERLTEDAIAFARDAAGLRRTGEMTAVANPALFERFVAANARRIRGFDAPEACITAVRDATEVPLAVGLERERSAFLRLVAGDQSKAQRHIFFAERAAARVEDLPRDLPLRDVRSVGVVGAGTMGSGIAMNFLSAGVPVTLVEIEKAALDRGVAMIRRNYEATEKKGQLSPESVQTALALLSPTLDFDALADRDLVIEAVYENMETKKEIFARLDRIVRPGAMLASNTSYLSIDDIAAVTKRPQDVLGLHFFSPANIMKLVEIVRGRRTAPDVLATGMALARRIGKVPVVAGVCHGFIGNRMLIPRQHQAEALLLEGASPEQIDQVHTRFGMPMGPFAMADLAGVDIGWHRDPARIDSIREALCSEGRWGQKTRAGFYDYDDKRRPSPSPVTAAILDRFRARSGVPQRKIGDDEIVVRTLYTMVNEGAKILEEGIAQRSSDIDVVWTSGYGWPRFTGGPMFWAGRVGLSTIVEGLKRHGDQLGIEFTIAGLLLERAAAGRTFEEA